MAKLVLKPELSPKHYKALLDAAYEAEGCMQPTAGKLLVLISLPLLVVWWVEDFGAHAGALERQRNLWRQISFSRVQTREKERCRCDCSSIAALILAGRSPSAPYESQSAQKKQQHAEDV